MYVFKEKFSQVLKIGLLIFFYGVFAVAHVERQAINTIIQGSAADVTKMAMIKVDKNVNQGFPKPLIQLVMHLHDELIFEVL